MNLVRWILTTTALIILIVLTIYVGTTGAFFVDNEQSSNDSLGFRWGSLEIEDGFEGTPWDENWDENGDTGWTRSSVQKRTGTYSALSNEDYKGYLTTDEIDASQSVAITISFYFRPTYLETGDVIVEIYNGSTWVTGVDLRSYSSYSNNHWCHLNEVIYASQYLFSGFRIRFNSSAISGNDVIYIDDVHIITDSLPPAAPTGLTATAGDTKVLLDWNNNTESDLEGYNIYRSLSSGSGYSKVNITPVTASQYTDTGRTNGTPYFYIVRAIDIAQNESTNSNEDSATPSDIAPDIPTGLVAVQGDTQVFLDWDDNTDYDLAGYNVYRSFTSNSSYSKINPSLLTGSNYTDSGLTNGIPCYYVVTAQDLTAHESAASAEATATPGDIPPAAPTGLLANAGDRSAVLDWNDNTEADLAGYNVYRSTTSGSGYSKINTSGIITSSNYTATGLNGGVTYYFVVTAVDNSSQESSTSGEDSATPYDNPPSNPTGLIATAGDKKVDLDWNDNTEEDVSGYNIYRSTTSGIGYSKINTSLVTASEYTDTGVSGGVTYYYVIKAVDGIAQASGYSSEENATPTDNPPAAPTGVTATPGERQITLDWDDNTETDLSGYNVYRSTSNGSGYIKINTSVLAFSTFTDTGVTGGTRYYYVLKAKDTAGHLSSYSSQVSAIPNDAAPVAPANLNIIPGDGSATLNWDDNTEDDLAGYNVYRSTVSGSGYVKVNMSLVTNSTWLNSGLTGGVTYYFVVTAVDDNSNESIYSTEANTTPTNTPPAKPTGLTAIPHDAEIELNWNDNTEGDFAGYNIYRSTMSGSGYTKINTSLVTVSYYNDTTAVNDVTYYYVITAVDITTSESVPSLEKSATPNLSPAAPTGLSATGGNLLVSLDWNDNAEADLTGYNIYRSFSSGTGYTKINAVPVTTSNYTDTGRTGGVTCYYVVTAVDSIDNESAYSAEDDATPTDAPPAAPAGLNGTPGDRESILDWNDNTETDLEGYNVYRSLSSGTGYSKLNTNPVTTSNYTDIGRTGGTTYYYIVTAIDNMANESANSTEVNVVPTDLAPAAPTSLLATTGDKQATLDWNDNTETDLAGYNVYRSETSGSGYSKRNTGLVGSSNYTDTGLTGDVTYYYVVTAVDATAHESTNSGEDSITATDVDPSPPTGLTATAGEKQVTLNWNANTEDDFDGYNVYRSTTSGTGYTKLNLAALVSSTSYTVTGLTPGTTYYFVVTAVDLGENESMYSSEVSAVPIGPTVINDNFENDPWYEYWNENGTPEWTTSTGTTHSSSHSAQADWLNNGYLTSDNLYASVTSNITVSFWYYPTSIDNGDAVVEIYNGTSWNTLADLRTYSQYRNNYWCHFDELITDSQYFIPNFKVRIDCDVSLFEYLYIDDALIVTDSFPPLQPTGLIATAGEEEVILDWDNNQENDLDGYHVYRSLSSGGTYSKITGSLIETSNYTDTGRTNGTPYFYRIKAVDVGGNESTYSNSANATPYDMTPSTPTGLTATAGYEEVSLDWNDNTEPDIDGYNIYRSLNSGTGYSKINASLVSASNYTDTGRTGGTTYYYRVTAVDQTSHESSYSNEVNCIPLNSPPDPPTGLTATPGDRQISLDWDNNSETDLNGYNVYRSSVNGSGYVKINTGLAGTSAYTDTGLIGGTTYYYVVTAVDIAEHESSYSSQSYATPTDPAPAAPTGLTATPGDRQVTLDWDDNTEDDIDGYNIYRSTTSNTSYVKINSGTIATSNYVDTGRTGYVTCYYMVTGIDAAGHESGYSNEDSTIPTDPPPAAPTGIDATTDDAEVILNWADNTEDDLAGYNLYRSTSNLTGYVQVNTGLIPVSGYTDSGLVGDITYYYMITAVDDAAYESANSSVVATPSDWIPTTPQGITAAPHDAAVTLDWDDNPQTDIAGYYVYRSTVNGTGYAKINGGSLVTTSNFSDTTTVNDTTYFYIITAYDLGGHESHDSDTVWATPDATPSAPTGLSATPGDRIVALNWNDNPEGDVIGYNVFRSITSGNGYSKINVEALVGTSNYTDTEMTGGITCYYVVTAVDHIDNESAISTEAGATPVDNPPAAPAGLTVTPGDRLVTLDWADNTETDLDGYNVYRSLSSNGSYSKINTGLVTNSAYTDTGRTGGTPYYYVVTAVDEIGNESPNSNEDTATPIDNPPAAPTGLAASAGDRQISLDWNDNTEDDFAGYNIYRKVSANGSYSKINTSLLGTSAYTDTGLTGGITYYYVVTAVDALSHESADSAEDSATATDPPPAVPSGLIATPHDAEVFLDWNDNTEDDFAGYNIYRSESSGTGYAQLNASNLTSSNYTDGTVVNDTTYFYVVTAFDDHAHESAYSREDSTTPDATPAAPTGLVATPGDRQISLDWNDNAESDIEGYNVYRSLTSGSGYAKINISIVEDSTYTDINLTNGTTYYYVVTAIDAIDNESQYSSEDSTSPTGLILIDDGFENSTWDINWDGNGDSPWELDTGTSHSGSNSALTVRRLFDVSAVGYLTTDSLDASTAYNLKISFWYRPSGIETGDCTVELYNGSSWTTWYDLRSYSAHSNGNWCFFEETITNSQYFVSDFRLRFNSTGITSYWTETVNIDDVLIRTNQ